MQIRHSRGSYDLDFRPLSGALADIPQDSVVVTDENVHAIYASRLSEGTRVLVVPAGEASKSVQVWSDLQSRLASMGATRATTLVAFGGGVMGDLAGFVAATYMRGVPLVQIPTTLLSQVDSSVGGKVGIDLPEGKNLVGAFYPPRKVEVSVECLGTLPRRQFINGMAEVWKYGFILDEPLVAKLRERQAEASFPDKPSTLDESIVRRCIELKKQTVEADEFERTGVRAKLNFGHTVGHAIEHVTGYGPVLHGEAISIGMVVEARLGERLGLSETGTASAVEESLRAEGLPTTSIVLRNLEGLISAMRRDKKARSGRLAFSLLERLGRCRLVEDVAEEDVRAILEKS